MDDQLHQTSTDGHHQQATLNAVRAELQLTRDKLEATRQSSALHMRALCAIGDGVVMVDRDGRILFINPVASHLCGWPEAEALGRVVEDVLEFSDSRGERVALRQPDDVAGVLRRRDRHCVPVEGTVTQLPCTPRDGGWVVIFRNVTAARRLADELAYHASHDSLTGLLNRRAFECRLQRANASAREQGARHALVCLDLDRFKDVNDRGGHIAGDELLRQIATVMLRQLRDGDVLARLGGDEFAVLLEHCLPEQSALVAEKVRVALAAYVFLWRGEQFRIGASLGLLDLGDGAESAKELLVRADALCYRAKNDGRDRVAVEQEHARIRRVSPRPKMGLEKKIVSNGDVL